MPIVNVEIYMKEGQSVPDCLARQLADAIADIFKVGVGKIWVRLSVTPQTQYAESGVDEISIYPIFVEILTAKDIHKNELKLLSKSISSSVGEITGTPQNRVHVVFAPNGAGRVAFGGNLVET